MRADTCNLYYRCLRGETHAASGGREGCRHFRRGGLSDHAAPIANEKHHEIASCVIVDAGDERIAACNPVNQSVAAQELQGAISGDGRGACACRREPLNELVGAKGLMAREQCREHLAATKGGGLATPPGPPFRPSHFIVGAPI